MNLYNWKKKTLFAIVVSLILFAFTIDIIEAQYSIYFKDLPQGKANNGFPFEGQKMIYDVTGTSLISFSGTLYVNYYNKINPTTINGSLHIVVRSEGGELNYNEMAFGHENLTNRDLYINGEDTVIINIFMIYFFDWDQYNVTPTPMWIFPEEMQANKTIQFWNYTATTYRSNSIALMDHYYEVFVFHIHGNDIDMTLMYTYARNDDGNWYGLLVYYSGSFIEPRSQLRMYAIFKLSYTNAELIPLEELNRSTILITTGAFYSIVITGVIIYRVKKRKDLTGGEV
ncbi:MAG: hypothetical protein FK734_08825 [Asgard group archaeon]|nr:hypothetical protein [Asgard group archaeon]